MEGVSACMSLCVFTYMHAYQCLAIPNSTQGQEESMGDAFGDSHEVLKVAESSRRWLSGGRKEGVDRESERFAREPNFATSNSWDSKGVQFNR